MASFSPFHEFEILIINPLELEGCSETVKFFFAINDSFRFLFKEIFVYLPIFKGKSYRKIIQSHLKQNYSFLEKIHVLASLSIPLSCVRVQILVCF